jgi:tartrate dehydrogenase/decarboxylase / D-malate dehydrogenase
VRTYSIAAIPGDGIGPEVIDAGLRVLRALEQKLSSFHLDVESFPWGSDFYKKTGAMMPANGLERLGSFHAIYFGAVGAPDIPDHVTLLGPAPRYLSGFRSIR